MKLRNQTQTEIPEADLIPMLNVMLGMMAYFIIVTMSMSSQSAFNLMLPEEVKGSDIDEAEIERLADKGPMMVELNTEGQFIVEEAKLDQAKLLAQLKRFVTYNQTDPIFLKPSDKQGYEKVLQTLAEMRKIGGDRVSLVIDDGA